jgi:hypothetical protein
MEDPDKRYRSCRKKDRVTRGGFRRKPLRMIEKVYHMPENIVSTIQKS